MKFRNSRRMNLFKAIRRSPAGLINHITALTLLISLPFATLANGQTPMQAQLIAAPPSVGVTVTPSAGNAVAFLPVAPETANEQPKALLALMLTIKNQEAAELHLSKVKVSFVGPPAVASSSFNTDFAVQPNKTKELSFKDEESLKLPYPTPKTVKIEMYFDGYAVPVVLSKALVAYANKNPQGSYRFPAKAIDLRKDEFWSGSSATHAGGYQRFAYDLGVVGWDANKKAWSHLLPGTTGEKNEDYRIWNKPVYAMADGIVIKCNKSQPDNPKPGEKISTGGGNSFWIQHGDEVVLYAHLRYGTINDDLWAEGAVVKAGDFLGRAGNSGSSSGPHLHIDTRPIKAEVMSLPLLFHDVYAIDRNALTPSDSSNAPWVAVKGKALPFSKNAIYPSATKPGSLPADADEVAKHAIPESEYQETIKEIVASGYRLVWVDGFDVDGKTYFNAIFRPVDRAPWTARHGLDGAAYQAEFEKLVKGGLKPEQVESYLDSGQLRYALIFSTKGSADFKAYHGRTPEEHQDLFESYTKAGYVPANISVVSTGGKRYYTALYQKLSGISFEAKSFLSAAEFQQAFNQNQGAGRGLVYLNAYHHAGSVRFSAIWRSGIAGPFVAHHGLSRTEYQSTWDNLTNKHYLTRFVTGYDAGNYAAFAALWRK